MVTAELKFEAYLNAAIPYVDLKYCTDPIVHRWILQVLNQGNQTLYFKLFNAVPNWDFGTELPGTDEKTLGSIGAGASSTYTIEMARTKPGAESFDGGNLTIKAYADSGYTEEVASADLYVTIDIQDIESWPDKTIWSFDDGTAQGWTLGPDVSVSNTKSIEAGGYSLMGAWYAGGAASPTVKTSYVKKTLSIPNRQKATLALFFTWYVHNPAYVSNVWIKAYAAGAVIFGPILLPNITQGIWHKLSLNLSQFKGQSKEIKIEFSSTHSTIMAGWFRMWLDRLVLAGKD